MAGVEKLIQKMKDRPNSIRSMKWSKSSARSGTRWSGSEGLTTNSETPRGTRSQARSETLFERCTSSKCSA